MGESPAIATTDRPVGGYARYVGRVGGLAFALGVGAAVLTGTAVASADTADSGAGGAGASSSSSSSSSSSQSSDTDAGPATSDDASESETESDAAESEPEADGETDTDGAESDSTETESDEGPVVDEDADTTAAAEDEGSADRQTAAPEDDAAVAPSAQSLSAPAEAAAAPANPFQTFFENESPTLTYDPTENTVVEGRIEGNLHPDDPDSTQLTYTATKPTHGTVVVNPNGTFVYTPGSTFLGQDSFDVTVSDARSGFHIHGFQGLLSLISFGILGNSGHRTTETVFIGFERAVVASGLNSPVDFRWLPDGRIVVAEKGGAIKIVDNGTVRTQPVITLSVNTAGERGISGLAIDPQFALNGHIYVAYTTSAVKDRLSRFTVIGNSASLGSEKILYETPGTVALYHHGGALGFGPDGKLYWGKGDDTTGSNAQNLTNIFGKILRLNPDGSTPSDNPSLGSGSLSQIYAYGLRNPFRLAFTPDGKLLVADVGNAAFEELNLVTAGGNYGWPGAEGLCTSNCAGLKNPIYTYARGGGAAITSVLVYNGGTFGPGYQNKVFIADTVQGWIKVLTCTPDFTSCGNVQDFDPDGGATVVLAQGPDGNIYQLLYSPGSIVRIAPAGTAPVAGLL